MGYMNVMWYVAKFDEALAALENAREAAPTREPRAQTKIEPAAEATGIRERPGFWSWIKQAF